MDVGVSSELLWSVEGGLPDFGQKVLTAGVDGCGRRQTQWTEVARRCLVVHMRSLCIPPRLSPGCSFRHSRCVSCGWNCTRPDARCMLCLNHILIDRSHWNEFVFLKQVLEQSWLYGGGEHFKVLTYKYFWFIACTFPTNYHSGFTGK